MIEMFIKGRVNPRSGSVFELCLLQDFEKSSRCNGGYDKEISLV